MKTLTLTQPWATLVAIGAKRIETRSWRTPYRGSLAIHAAKGYPQWAKDLCYEEPFKSALAAYPGPPVPIGCVLAIGQLLACIPTRELQSDGPIYTEYGTVFALDAKERAFGDYEPGRWAWLLADVTPLPVPVPARGALSLWEWRHGS